jgi:hypothetical protein
MDVSAGHLESNHDIPSPMFNATHNIQTPFNVHEFRDVPTSSADPATKYLPGYGTFLTTIFVDPLELRLQDSPAAEPGDGTKFLTVYALNKQYTFSKTQHVRAAVPTNSVALKCADFPKLTILLFPLCLTLWPATVFRPLLGCRPWRLSLPNTAAIHNVPATTISIHLPPVKSPSDRQTQCGF